MKPRWRRSSAYMSIMKLTALAPKIVSISALQVLLFGGKRWKRGGTYHMTARPSREVRHQQEASQLHVQPNGLWIFVRRFRRTVPNPRRAGRARPLTDGPESAPSRQRPRSSTSLPQACASRRGVPLALALLDLDHFKQINDTYGHGVGDDALAAFGTTVRAVLRASDFVGRHGGEEFVVLLPETERAQALTVAEKVRSAVATITIPDVDRPITVSIGVAVFPDDATEAATLLRQADRALYLANANGRNRIQTIQQTEDAAGRPVRSRLRTRTEMKGSKLFVTGDNLGMTVASGDYATVAYSNG